MNSSVHKHVHRSESTKCHIHEMKWFYSYSTGHILLAVLSCFQVYLATGCSFPFHTFNVQVSQPDSRLGVNVEPSYADAPIMSHVIDFNTFFMSI